MATYGARYIQWAPFAAADADNDSSKYPSYGAPMNLGALQKVTDAPTNNEAKTYGDDVLDAYVSEFKEYTLDVEVTEVLNEVASAVTGAEIVVEGKDLEFGAEDVAPYGGLAFFVSKMLKSGGRKYQGIYYPKMKASVTGEEYTTKGESITLAGGKLHFVGTTCAKGKWKVKSTLMDTMEAAKAWVDEKIKETAGG